MTKGYQFRCDYGDGCGMKEYKSHEHLGADYVLASDYAALEAERDAWRKRAHDAEHRVEHPPLPENQDDLARICYEAYMQYTSPESLEDKSWADLCAWESYGWRLAANAVRVATEAERDELKRRMDAMVKMLGDCGTQMVRFEKYGGAQSKFAHGVYEHACLIAEGRDNG